MATHNTACSMVSPKETTPTLTSDIGVLIARVEANEATASRIAARIFGAQPSPQQGASSLDDAIEDSGYVLERDILRVVKSAQRTRELLEQLEVRLG